MNELLDIGNIATGYITRNLPKILDIGHSVVKGAKAEITLKLKTAYASYIEYLEERYGKAKSFFFRSTPTDIYEFYVPLGVNVGNKKLEKVSLDSIVDVTKQIVVSAPAGSGKSMLLRHFLLNALRKSDRIPIFIELRNLSNSNNTVFDEVEQTLKDSGFNLGIDYIKKAMKFGHFVILLDGFDEIDFDSRDRISKQVVKLARTYRDCVFVVSSRPDDTFSGWNDFTELSITPLTVDDACELVNKLPVDIEIKSKFMKDLQGFLFSRHESFLSNPLLLSIMLLTYGENAEIPQKLSLFYNQAYFALYNRHDALKGGYQRERKTSLDSQDFERVFATFCLQTYDQRKFSFSRSDALEYIRKSKHFVSMEFGEEDFLHDCLQSVNLLMEDGLSLVFSHRSFQEYFVARYIHSADPRVQPQLINKFLPFIRRDSVFKLLFEINPGLVERELLIPGLKRIFDHIKVKRTVGITHFVRLLRENFSEVHVGKDRVVLSQSIRRNRNYTIDIILFAYECCSLSRNWETDDDRYNQFVEKFGGEKEKIYLTSKVPMRSQFFRELAEISGFMSMEWLRQAYELYLKLSKEHEGTPKLLEDLLN